ncbi:MAG: DUF952 domain-containing protein [Hyphomicrobiales bacterium]
MSDRFIFKLLTLEQWHAFKAKNIFTGAPVDVADGYIHFSSSAQVAETAAKYFSDLPNVVLAEVDTEKLSTPVVWEPSRGGALFPHLYATLPRSAVTRTTELEKDTAGQFIFPDWVVGI